MGAKANGMRQDMNDRFEGGGAEGRKEVLRGVDELFAATKEYASSARFRELLEFAGRFRQFAPYNAMLIYLQRPGARFVLSPRDWLKKYNRVIRKDTRPILVLAPHGPRKCLYDVGDTLPQSGVLFDSFPSELSKPFENESTQPVPPGMLRIMVDRLACLGICYGTMQTGSGLAAKIEAGGAGDPDLHIEVSGGRTIRWQPVYSIRVAEGVSDTVKFCSIVHELGHLFCRHLKDGYAGRTPGFRDISHAASEFEAESVAWLVARRLGVESPSDRYLADYLEHNGEIPPETSVEEILRAAYRVEQILEKRSEALEYFCARCPAFKRAQGRVRSRRSGRLSGMETGRGRGRNG